MPSQPLPTHRQEVHRHGSVPRAVWGGQDTLPEWSSVSFVR
jgi:hypothetical protein